MAAISKSVSHRLYPAAGDGADDADDAAQHNKKTRQESNTARPKRLPCGWLCVSAPPSQSCFFRYWMTESSGSRPRLQYGHLMIATRELPGSGNGISHNATGCVRFLQTLRA
jgi:hypothetical protein